jgi:hypothetical protein
MLQEFSLNRCAPFKPFKPPPYPPPRRGGGQRWGLERSGAIELLERFELERS